MPALGYFNSIEVFNDRIVGNYWSATSYDNNEAWYCYFYSEGVSTGYYSRNTYLAIRLIKNNI